MAQMDTITIQKVEHRRDWEVNNVQIGTNELNICQKRALLEVLKRFKDVFSDNPGIFKGYKYKITTIVHEPFKDR